MNVLIAEDDLVLRCGLEAHVSRWGYMAVACADGLEANRVLDGPEPPHVALLDRSMPGLDGLTLCRRIRATPSLAMTYVILLTAHDEPEDMLAGLEGGADEYLTKPIEWQVLRARLRIGVRIATLQHSLAQRVQELQEALASVKQLQGLLPICSYCKSIRDDQNYWQKLETYVSQRTDAHFTHGVCPACYDRMTGDCSHGIPLAPKRPG